MDSLTGLMHTLNRKKTGTFISQINLSVFWSVPHTKYFLPIHPRLRPFLEVDKIKCK